MIALAAAILWHVQGFPAMPGQRFGPAWFPGLIAVGLAVCGVLLVIGGVRAGGPWITPPDWIVRRRALSGVGAVLGGLLFYILAADTLGFHLVSMTLLTAWVRLLGGRWRVALCVAVLATIVIHLSFYKLLRVPLPWGVLERYAF